MRIKRMGMHTLKVPKLESEGAAGYDLRASVPKWVEPGERVLVPTGFAWEIPTGWVGLVKPRSGLAVKKGLDTMAGVIDSDYRGEVHVLLINLGHERIEIVRGDRIAQMVVLMHGMAPLVEVPELDDTDRGSGGFNSTGVQ